MPAKPACQYNVEISFKGCVIVQSMMASSKDTAEKVLETQIMEMLQALVVEANIDSAQPNPHWLR